MKEMMIYLEFLLECDFELAAEDVCTSPGKLSVKG